VDDFITCAAVIKIPYQWSWWLDRAIYRIVVNDQQDALSHLLYRWQHQFVIFGYHLVCMNNACLSVWKMIQCCMSCMYVCVCMYVCLYVCMYVCMCVYVCVSVCVCVCMYVCVYVCMFLSMYECMYVCIHILKHTVHSPMKYVFFCEYFLDVILKISDILNI
jgi:hypothetical protein